jgi:hypothetical protein
MIERKLLFPTTVIENFYDNPDSIREMALNLPYNENPGYYPGRKTPNLSAIDPELNYKICKKFMSVFYDFLHPIDFEIRTEFDLAYKHSDVKYDPINRGWIHQDIGSVIAGIVYLTPNANPDSGTNLYAPKKTIREDWFNVLDENSNARFPAFKSYGKQYDVESYNAKYYETESFFNKILTVDNIYNRLIVFDAAHWHGYNTLVCGNDPRLVQLFFVQKIGQYHVDPPYVRIRNTTL